MLLPPRKALSKAYLKVKPNRTGIEAFKRELIQVLDSINEYETEEHHKNLLSWLLSNCGTSRRITSTPKAAAIW